MTKWGSQKVAVFGDASASMQCAIEAGAIFSSMSSVCLDGELSFFRTNLVESPYPKPQTVEETLEVCQTIQADGSTCPGACLLPYLESKIWLNTIGLVTDEEENLGNIPDGELENMTWITITTEEGEALQVVQSDGFLFNHHLKNYMDTVNQNVQLVVVCIGSGNPTFRYNLTQQGIVPQIKTNDGKRPDLTKFDTLLGQIVSWKKTVLEERRKKSMHVMMMTTMTKMIMVRVAVVRFWLSTIGLDEDARDGIRYHVVEHQVLFYADNRLLGATDPDWLQTAPTELVAIFEWVGLKANPRKTKSMVCFPGRIRTSVSLAGYK